MASYLVTGLSALLGSVSAAVSHMGRGWGDHINWVSLDEAQSVATQTGKYIMVIAHQEKCPACVHLQKRFAESPEIKKLSKQFVMVNVETPDVPPHNQFYPDGLYVPRIMFYSPQGKLIKGAIGNKKKRVYRYNYAHVDTLVETMERVLRGEEDGTIGR